MSSRHEAIKWDVITEWTKQGRGRLYCMNQGLAIPWADYENARNQSKIGNLKWLLNLIPKWFGPLKRKFKGFPDTFGFETETFYDYPIEGAIRKVPVFCTVEVKTINDDLSADQKRVMKYLTSVGVRCYVAKETSDSTDEAVKYELTRWEG